MTKEMNDLEAIEVLNELRQEVKTKAAFAASCAAVKDTFNRQDDALNLAIKALRERIGE